MVSNFLKSSFVAAVSQAFFVPSAFVVFLGSFPGYHVTVGGFLGFLVFDSELLSYELAEVELNMEIHRTSKTFSRQGKVFVGSDRMRLYFKLEIGRLSSGLAR